MANVVSEAWGSMNPKNLARTEERLGRIHNLALRVWRPDRIRKKNESEGGFCEFKGSSTRKMDGSATVPESLAHTEQRTTLASV